MKTDDRGALRHFFGLWFARGWDREGLTPDDIVQTYLRAERSPVQPARLAQQIEDFAAGVADDAQLEDQLVRDLRCAYRPSADGTPARDWLRHVARLLRRAR